MSNVSGEGGINDPGPSGEVLEKFLGGVLGKECWMIGNLGLIFVFSLVTWRMGQRLVLCPWLNGELMHKGSAESTRSLRQEGSSRSRQAQGHRVSIGFDVCLMAS